MSSVQADIAGIESELKAHVKHDDERYATIQSSISELRELVNGLIWKVGVIAGGAAFAGNGIAQFIGGLNG